MRHIIQLCVIVDSGVLVIVCTDLETVSDALKVCICRKVRFLNVNLVRFYGLVVCGIVPNFVVFNAFRLESRVMCSTLIS